MKEKITIKPETSEEKEECIRIYATKKMLDILDDQNYEQFFLDGTFKCVPKGN